MYAMKVEPGDVIVLTGNVDSYDGGNPLVELAKKFPDNSVIYVPEGVTLKAMSIDGAIKFLETMIATLKQEGGISNEN